MPSKFRNVALIGHHGTGKTTLAESLLFGAGAIKRKGSIDEQNTVSDFDHDEKERRSSLEAAILHCDHDGTRINLIDAPGTPAFIAGVVEALEAVEAAVITVDAAAGVEAMTRKLWGMIETRGVGRIVMVTKMDHERAKFEPVVEQLREIFGPAVTPLFLPIGSGNGFSGVVDLLDDLDCAPPDIAERARDMAGSLKESIIAADEALMERYLMDEKISKAEIGACFSRALLSGDLVPVLCCSAEKDIGIKETLDVLAHYAPAPDALPREVQKKVGDKIEKKKLDGSPDGPFYARVFKSKRDAFIGKISYLRVLNGKLAHGATAQCSSASKPDKFAHFLTVQGKDSQEVPDAVAGDIVAVAKVDHLHCGDTVTTDSGEFVLASMGFPEPMSALAVEAKNRKDEGKISEQLRHLAEGDPTFKVDVNSETHELVIRGTGQLHLDLQLARLKQHGIEVNTHLPKIAYRSTVTTSAEVRYRHKKQSGGAGQFGEVQILIEPNPGNGYEFVDKIVGGVIPNTLIPSVDKGIIKKMTDGVWPGIPVVDIKVSLTDGKHHPVDSKDIAFQIAGRHALTKGFEEAKPALIEPVVHLEIMVPGKYLGDITGLISGKRGRVQGMDQMGDMQVIKANAPASEVQNFAGELKSITGGEGFYSMEFSHYDPVPHNIAQPVIDAARAAQKHDDD